MANEKIPTPVMYHIKHLKDLMEEKKKNKHLVELMSFSVTTLEGLLENEMGALMIAHAKGRGASKIEQVEVDWFNDTFQAYEKG